MEKDLHTRLAEAREQGYKEAIERAKAWLKEQLNYVPMDGFLAQFETDMNNKLWEEK